MKGCDSPHAGCVYDLNNNSTSPVNVPAAFLQDPDKTFPQTELGNT